MPRELSFAGIYVPTLFILFLAVAIGYFLLDWMLARVGAYRWVWHVDLFRLCLFTVLFAAAGMLVYR
jgi:protein AaeX